MSKAPLDLPNHLKESWAKIENLDFSNTIYKMVNYLGWLQFDAKKVCTQYKRFLYLLAKYRHQFQIPPSECIDEFWHQHILDTKRYMADCNSIFGEYIHHYPFFGIDEKSNMQDLNSAFAKMMKLYELEFGESFVRVRKPWLEPLLKLIRRTKLRKRHSVR